MSLLNIKKREKKSERKKSDLMGIIKGEKNTVKFTVNIPTAIHRDFKTFASSEGRQMTDIVISLILAHLKNKKT